MGLSSSDFYFFGLKEFNDRHHLLSDAPVQELEKEAKARVNVYAAFFPKTAGRIHAIPKDISGESSGLKLIRIMETTDRIDDTVEDVRRDVLDTAQRVLKEKGKKWTDEEVASRVATTVGCQISLLNDNPEFFKSAQGKKYLASALPAMEHLFADSDARYDERIGDLLKLSTLVPELGSQVKTVISKIIHNRHIKLLTPETLAQANKLGFNIEEELQKEQGAKAS